MSEDERHMPIDAVREASCKDRMDGFVSVCRERHESVADKFESINGKLNFVLGVCVVDFVAILIAILK